MRAPYTIVSAKTFPRVEALVTSVLEGLPTPAGTWACRHVMAGQLAAICVDHPKLGLMCRKCIGVHDQRHDAEAKHRCDACGRQSERMHDQTTTVSVNLRVRVPRGTRGRYVGPVVIGALGACPPCVRTFIGEEAAQ